MIAITHHGCHRSRFDGGHRKPADRRSASRLALRTTRRPGTWHGVACPTANVNRSVMNYFEDFGVGMRTEIGSHTFTADEIKAFAREFDPQPFHLDEEAAARSHFGALCASGWHTAAICLRLVVQERHRRQAELRRRGEPVAKTGPSPGFRDLRWPKPVYAGDTITFATEVVALHDVVKRPDVGLRIARNTGTNQRGDLVYSVLSSTYIERRNQPGRT